jgi:hypothetical protein
MATMEIRNYSTNISVFSQPVEMRAERAQNRPKSPETDKVTIVGGNTGSPPDVGAGLEESKLKAAAEGINTTGSPPAVPKLVEDGRVDNAKADNSKEQVRTLPDTKGKAYFALDDNKNVVIKVEDSKGNVVRQIPPEDYIKMSKTLRELSTNLFHTTA